MRIISGTFKGRRINAPKKLPVRPTTDMAKEGLFNILNNNVYFDEISVLDLFSSEEFKMGITVHKANVFTYLEKTGSKSDIIFADPPYNMELSDFERIHQLVFGNELLLPEGQLIIEHAKQTKLSHLPGFLSDRKYGGSVFSFFGTRK